MMYQPNYSTTRSPSRPVLDPVQAYQNYMSDWDARMAAMRNAQTNAPSFNDHLATDVASAFNNAYGTADNSTLSPEDRARMWGAYYTTAESAFNPASWASLGATGYNMPTGVAGQAANTLLGSGLASDIANYQVPDFTDRINALNNEKRDAIGAFTTQINNQRSLQNAYTQQLGGGYAGGVLPDPSQAFAVASVGQNTNGVAPASSANPTTGVMPWATPGYSAGGLGGLGGYNPNPWNTSTPSASQPQNPWGGPFGASNPFSPSR